MLKKDKCILTYGLSPSEIEGMKKLNQKIIEITPEMCQMKVKDILSGMKLETVNNYPIQEKAIIYNDFSQVETNNLIKRTRDVVKGGVLAVVTPISRNWSVNYLIEHLVEEREWYLKNRKG